VFALGHSTAERIDMNVVDMCFQQLKRSEDRLRPTAGPCAFSRGVVEDINNMSISDML
jgi:hypothetical protein